MQIYNPKLEAVYDLKHKSCSFIYNNILMARIKTGFYVKFKHQKQNI